MVTLYSAQNLTIDGCVNELQKEARDRGETLTREDAYSAGHRLLSSRMAQVRERAIAIMRANGTPALALANTRRATAPAPEPDEPEDLIAILSREVDRRVSEDSLTLTDAIDEVRDEIEIALVALAKPKGKKGKKSKAPEVEASDESEIEASEDPGEALGLTPEGLARAATKRRKPGDALAAEYERTTAGARVARDTAEPRRFVPLGMDPVTAAAHLAGGSLPFRTNTPDLIGDRARALQGDALAKGDEPLSWETAITMASRPPMNEGIPLRSERLKAKAGAR